MLEYLHDYRRYATLGHDEVAIMCDLIVERGFASMDDWQLVKLERFECQTAFWISVWLHKKTGLEFSLIPGGTYMMGSPEDEVGRFDDEKQREVTVKPMWVARTTAYDQETRLPIVNITWDDAVKWCKDRSVPKVELKLPKEEQWEFFCRAGTTTRFTCGDDEETLREYGWFWRDGGHAVNAEGRPCAPGEAPVGARENCLRQVGLLKPNAFGLYDVHGNVWEWTSSPYERGDEQRPDPTGESREDTISVATEHSDGIEERTHSAASDPSSSSEDEEGPDPSHRSSSSAEESGTPSPAALSGTREIAQLGSAESSSASAPSLNLGDEQGPDPLGTASEADAVAMPYATCEQHPGTPPSRPSGVSSADSDSSSRSRVSGPFTSGEEVGPISSIAPPPPSTLTETTSGGRTASGSLSPSEGEEGADPMTMRGGSESPTAALNASERTRHGNPTRGDAPIRIGNFQQDHDATLGSDSSLDLEGDGPFVQGEAATSSLSSSRRVPSETPLTGTDGGTIKDAGQSSPSADDGPFVTGVGAGSERHTERPSSTRGIAAVPTGGSDPSLSSGGEQSPDPRDSRHATGMGDDTLRGYSELPDDDSEGARGATDSESQSEQNTGALGIRSEAPTAYPLSEPHRPAQPPSDPSLSSEGEKRLHPTGSSFEAGPPITARPSPSGGVTTGSPMTGVADSSRSDPSLSSEGEQRSPLDRAHSPSPSRRGTTSSWDSVEDSGHAGEGASTAPTTTTESSRRSGVLDESHSLDRRTSSDSESSSSSEGEQRRPFTDPASTSEAGLAASVSPETSAKYPGVRGDAPSQAQHVMQQDGPSISPSTDGSDSDPSLSSEGEQRADPTSAPEEAPSTASSGMSIGLTSPPATAEVRSGHATGATSSRGAPSGTGSEFVPSSSSEDEKRADPSRPFEAATTDTTSPAMPGSPFAYHAPTDDKLSGEDSESSSSSEDEQGPDPSSRLSEEERWGGSRTPTRSPTSTHSAQVHEGTTQQTPEGNGRASDPSLNLASYDPLALMESEAYRSDPWVPSPHQREGVGPHTDGSVQRTDNTVPPARAATPISSEASTRASDPSLSSGDDSEPRIRRMGVAAEYATHRGELQGVDHVSDALPQWVQDGLTAIRSMRLNHIACRGGERGTWWGFRPLTQRDREIRAPRSAGRYELMKFETTTRAVVGPLGFRPIIEFNQ